MRLSDIKGDRTLEVIAEIIDPIANIEEDEEASAMFKREKLPDGMTAKKFLMNRVRKSLPVLLKCHKADIIAILSSIEGVSTEEYAGALNLWVNKTASENNINIDMLNIEKEKLDK